MMQYARVGLLSYSIDMDGETKLRSYSTVLIGSLPS